MATFAQFRHVELDRVGRGKKRVTHPPGGKPKLECEAAPSPKAVRVLKPPGGGSSISFGDDNAPLPTKHRGATAPLQSAPDADEAAAAAVEESAPPAAAEASTDSGEASCAEAEAPEQSDAPSPSTSNGTTSESHSESSGSESSSSNGVSDGSAVGDAEVSKKSVGNGVNSPEANGSSDHKTSNGTHPETNGVCHGKSNGAVENGEGKCNGSHSSSNGPGASENGDSAPASPVPESAPTPKSPVSPSPASADTKGRLFSEESTRKPLVTRSTPSNHHMRSSIFPSYDESYATSNGDSSPTEKSKPVAAVPRQQPPVRVRQPPGGFSSQLW